MQLQRLINTKMWSYILYSYHTKHQVMPHATIWDQVNWAYWPKGPYRVLVVLTLQSFKQYISKTLQSEILAQRESRNRSLHDSITWSLESEPSDLPFNHWLPTELARSVNANIVMNNKSITTQHSCEANSIEAGTCLHSGRCWFKTQIWVRHKTLSGIEAPLIT